MRGVQGFWGGSNFRLFLYLGINSRNLYLDIHFCTLGVQYCIMCSRFKMIASTLVFTSSLYTSRGEQDGCDDDDPLPAQDYNDADGGDVVCIDTQPDWEQGFEQGCTVNITASDRTNKRKKVTYRDFTDVANSVTNLALSLPTEDARKECLGF